jgi:flagellar hook-basal body complex protein FliE
VIGADAIGTAAAAAAAREPAAPAGRAGSGGFAQALGRALEATEALQGEADRQAAEVALGGGNLHEASIALEKADVALRFVTRVRNRVVEAYQDVMRMQV